MDKIKSLLNAGRHHRIEQFTVMFVVLAVLLVGTTVGCFSQYLGARDNTMNETAIYTSTFQTSRTDVSGTVEGVYASEDKTKVLVLLKFEDMTNMSVNADNYRAFLSYADVAGNGNTLKSSPSGSIYLFGNSGYMGVYLVDKNGFEPQVLDLVIRCNIELKESADETDSDSVEDGSFAKYDQLQVFINPAASEAESLACLNDDSAPTVLEMYNEAVVVKEEESIHEELEATLESMQINLNQIEEYTNRLAGTDGVNVPDAPALIKGDSIEVQTDENGNETLVYKPATVVSGGWDFDWRDHSVTEGFLDDLIKESDSPNMTYDQYFTQKTREYRDGKDSIDMSTDWTLTDGTLLSDTDEDSTKYKNIESHIAALRTAWSGYYQNKQTYQRTLLGELLHLEADASLIDSSASINTNADVITCY